VKKSRITFEIESARVETIVGLLIDQVSDFQVTEVHRENGGVSGKGKSTKWTHTAALTVIEHMKKTPDKEFFYKDLGPLIVKHGMKETSITPVISALYNAGKIKKTRRGYYKAA
jgi:hypothetical protein